MQNLSYENEFDLHSNDLVSKTDFHERFRIWTRLKQTQKELRNGLLTSLKLAIQFTVPSITDLSLAIVVIVAFLYMKRVRVIKRLSGSG